MSFQRRAGEFLMCSRLIKYYHIYSIIKFLIIFIILLSFIALVQKFFNLAVKVGNIIFILSYSKFFIFFKN